MKVLIFGKYGQVGSQLVRLFEALPGYHVEAVDAEDIDLTDINAIEPFIVDTAPDWVINASAHTAVDKAESESGLSFSLNADAPTAMARACAAIGAHMVHYSTDYVFNGSADRPYEENDTPDPQSVYGRSKLAGENGVLQHLPDAIILRTAWVYAENGHNFVNTMLRLAGERPAINVVSDQHGSPTLADDLAQATVNILDGVVNDKYELVGGVFHATGQGETSWYEFCLEIMKEAGHDAVEINPISTEQYPTAAPRPAYSVLNNDKLFRYYEQRLPDWRASLHRRFHSDV